MNKTYAAYFFDFDGVIADSVEIKTEAFRTLFIDYGPLVVRNVANHHRENGGMPRREKFEHYLRHFLETEPTPKRIDHMCALFSGIVVDKVVAAPEIPGALDYIRKAAAKAPCFIISGTPDEELGQIVKRRGLAPFFREIMGSGKKKPQHLAATLTKYNLSAAECVFFGDAGSDFKAARANGVPFIGILPGPDAPLLKQHPTIRWHTNFEESN